MIGGRTGQEQIKSQLSNPLAPCVADFSGFRVGGEIHFISCELVLQYIVF